MTCPTWRTWWRRVGTSSSTGSNTSRLSLSHTLSCELSLHCKGRELAVPKHIFCAQWLDYSGSDGSAFGDRGELKRRRLFHRRPVFRRKRRIALVRLRAGTSRISATGRWSRVEVGRPASRVVGTQLWNYPITVVGAGDGAGHTSDPRGSH
jgi:hypothetical protein